MQALVWLILAAAVLGLGGGHWLGRAAALVLASMAGLTLPDLDQLLPLDHRSAITHSVLPIAVALYRPGWWPVAGGLALGLGFHLAADVFPNSMVGFATVKLPFAGSMGPGASYLWLAANSVAATLAGVVLAARDFAWRIALALLSVVLAIGASYLFVTDGGWPALGVYGTGGWLALRRYRGLEVR